MTALNTALITGFVGMVVGFAGVGDGVRELRFERLLTR